MGKESARRYFDAVQGSDDQKGELFGIQNLFRLQTQGTCLTRRILEVRSQTGCVDNPGTVCYMFVCIFLFLFMYMYAQVCVRVFLSAGGTSGGRSNDVQHPHRGRGGEEERDRE